MLFICKKAELEAKPMEKNHVAFACFLLLPLLMAQTLNFREFC